MVVTDLDGRRCILAMLYDVTDRIRTERAQRLLAEATRRLYSSLDQDTILETLAHVAVPGMASWCTVDILREDGSVGLVAASHIDPAGETLAARMRDGTTHALTGKVPIRWSWEQVNRCWSRT